MSSRHSSFSRSSAPRAWRSMSKPATAVPSVSIVFAEPEHAAAAEGSAAALLNDSPESSPPRRRDAASSLRKASYQSLKKGARDAADTAVRDVVKNEEVSTMANEQRAGWLGRSLSAEPVQDSSARESSAPPEPQQPPPASPIPFPTTPDSKPTSGWFSRSPARAPTPTIVATPSPAAAPVPTPVPAPAPTPTPTPTSEPAPKPTPTPPRKPTPPQDIPPAPRTTTGWFTRGHAPASSVDDTVPIPAVFHEPPTPPEHGAVRPRDRADSNNLSSLNPSTSRFTLAMPLLGRPKVPLEQALQAQGAASASASTSASVKTETAEQEQEEEQRVAPPAQPPSESSSWWGYIGLASASKVALPESPAPSVNVESPTSDAAPEAPPDVPPEAPPAAPSDASSTWYTPWRWYGAPPAPDAPPPGKTQAELVKEAALARPSPPSSPVPPPSPPANPVLATSDNRASWVSFFTSASMRGRAVTETGEMEVMHVDDDAPPRPASPAPSAPAALTTKTPPSPKNPPSPKKPPPRPPVPNLVLPSFDDTFRAPPRSVRAEGGLRRTLRRVLFAEDPAPRVGDALPRLWDVLGETETLGSVRRVVVIGIHGWFPGSLIRQVLGEPTGTSSKFAGMMAAAVLAHFAGHGVPLPEVTQIVLEGEGTIAQRVDNLYQEYLKNEAWVADLQSADAVLIATHSQGSIVSTQLLDRLLATRHVRAPPQRVCVLAMCGIHLGPLRYLNTSSLVQPYLQYFESAAARELFEFQDSESQVARTYVQALARVLEHGAKFVYVASLNDQVVPIYSGSFTTASHPLLLRALYIDGEAYSSSDFLSSLLVLLLRLRNAGLDDEGLIAHLSEATAGSLSGVGHSAAYEEPATYALAVRFLFETSGALGPGARAPLAVQTFAARAARNDYEIPWALRDVIANPDAAALFASEFAALRAAFDGWHPRTTVLRELRRKLEPIRRARL